LALSAKGRDASQRGSGKKKDIKMDKKKGPRMQEPLEKKGSLQNRRARARPFRLTDGWY